MLDAQTPLTAPPPTLWRRVTQFFFEAHPSITEGSARRQARLVSIIASVITATNIIAMTTVFFVVGNLRAGVVLIGLTIASTVGYALSRTQFHKIGAYTIVWTLALAAFVGGSPGNLSNSLYSNLIPALVIASITFPFRYMTFFVVLSNIVIALLPFVYNGYTNIGLDLSVFIPFSLLIMIAVRYRDNVERDRLAKLQQVNQELTSLSNELEQRVRERTAKLEERARQLQAVTEVARAAASFQDLERLLTNSTRLISESFGFYHVGIFLLDDEGQHAILRAANSEGGQRMLARRHMLPVDLNSIVGYTAKTQAARIALDTGADAVYFNNPDLPETCSEMAVPLKVGTRLIGILDVQSTQKNAFSEEDIAILGTLGDQLAVAMDNTRLLTETRRALITVEQTYQRYFNQAWAQFARSLKREGYRYQDGSVLPLDEKSKEKREEVNNKSSLSIPLLVRGQDIGTLDILPKSEERKWSTDEIVLLEAAAERAALALESARLLEEAQKRAAREQAISEIANSLSRTSKVETILQTTVEELGRRLSSTRGVTIALADINDNKEAE